MSPEVEQKLLRVVTAVATAVNSGEHPNTAIVKAARAGQLRSGEIDVVVRAYNTGTTNRQREDATDLFSKAAEFALADAEAIRQELYPAAIKTAAQQQQAVEISEDYAMPVVKVAAAIQQARHQRAMAPLVKAAAVKTPAPARELDPLSTRALNLKVAAEQRRQREYDETRRQYTVARDKAAAQLYDLGMYFRTIGALPVATVKEAAVIIHGDIAATVIDGIVAEMPQITKSAGQQSARPIALTDISTSMAPFPQLAAVIAAAKDYHEKHAAWAAIEIKEPAPVPPTTPSILDDFEKEASMVGAATGNMGYQLLKDTFSPIAKHLAGPPPDDRITSLTNKLDAPEHLSKLREINTRAMLQDLITNDPIVSSYDPQEVVDAYNTISQIGPSLGERRGLITTLLRQQLQQGQLGAFEQGQILDFDKQVRQQSLPLATRG